MAAWWCRTRSSLSSPIVDPQVLFARCEERGYGLCDITPNLWTTQLRTVVDPLRADSGIRTQARFVVQDRLAGPQGLANQ